MNKKILLSMFLAGMNLVGGYQSFAHVNQLPTVYVKGQSVYTLPGGFVSSKGTLGMLGAKDIMNMPFDQTQYTEKTIERFTDPTNNFVSIMTNNPSVRSSSIITHGHFFVHGVYTHGSYVNVNNVPNLIGQFSTPTFFVDQIDLNTSPNMGLNGSRASYAMGNQANGSPALINFHTKKAILGTVIKYKQGISGRSVYTEHLDFGKRIGDDAKWGIRMNVLNTNGEISLKGVHRKEQGYTINIDHQGDGEEANLFLGYYYLHLDGGHRWFNLGKDVTHLPIVPNHYNNYDFDGQLKWEKTWMAAFNYEKELKKDWKFFLNAGTSYHDFNWALFGYGGGWEIKNDKGDFNTFTKPGYQDWRTYFLQVGLRGDIQIGKVRHYLTVAVDKSWYNSFTPQNPGSGSANIGSGQGNIYTGMNGREQHIIEKMGNRAKNESEYVKSLSLNDFIEIDNWGVLLGIQRTNNELISHSNKSQVSKSEWCPTVGLVYKYNDNIMSYANYTEGFTRPSIVKNKYINKGDVLPAMKLKQFEVGYKIKRGDSLITISGFNIKQSQNIDIKMRDTPQPTDIQVGNGQVVYRGVSASYTGKIAPKWNVMGGVEYVHSKQEKTTKKIMEGEVAFGTPYWNGVMAMEYEPNEKWSVLGRAIFTGSAKTVNKTKEKIFSVPSYTVFDLGVCYKTDWNKIPISINAMCFNVFDNNYWYTHKTSIMLSTPRTFSLSLTAEF